jgi:hypothetical protein
MRIYSFQIILLLRIESTFGEPEHLHQINSLELIIRLVQVIHLVVFLFVLS